MKKFLLLIASTVVILSFGMEKNKERNTEFYLDDSCGREKLQEEVNKSKEELKKLFDTIKKQNFNFAQLEKINQGNEIKIALLEEQIKKNKKNNDTSVIQNQYNNKNKTLNTTSVLKKKDEEIKELKELLQKSQIEAATLYSAAQLLVKTEEKNVRAHPLKPQFRDSVVVFLTLFMFIVMQETSPWLESFL